MQQLSPLADYLVINISSPNTPNLRALQKSSELSTILEQVLAERDRMNAAEPKERQNDKGNVCPPILIKISPDLEPAQRKEIAQVALHYKVDGIIISNTTTARPIHGYDSQEVETAKEQGKTRSLMPCLFAFTHHSFFVVGGLSGKPLYEPSTELLREMYQLTEGTNGSIVLFEYFCYINILW